MKSEKEIFGRELCREPLGVWDDDLNILRDSLHLGLRKVLMGLGG